MTTYTIYRFVESVNDAYPGGNMILDADEVEYWKKRFTWMAWVAQMGNYELELMLIGFQHPERPFLHKRSVPQLNDFRSRCVAIVAKHGPTSKRQLLVEETYSSIEDAYSLGDWSDDIQIWRQQG